MAMATSSREVLDREFGSSESIVQESPADAKFDAVVGELENLLLDDGFLQMQDEFLLEHTSKFDYDEENKLVYMDVFKDWTRKIEHFIEDRLKQTLPWFTMVEFTKMIHERSSEQMEGDVFDVLATLGDFAAFKDLILSYKHEHDGTGIDLSGVLIQSGSNKKSTPSKSG